MNKFACPGRFLVLEEVLVVIDFGSGNWDRVHQSEPKDCPIIGQNRFDILPCREGDGPGIFLCLSAQDVRQMLKLSCRARDESGGVPLLLNGLLRQEVVTW